MNVTLKEKYKDYFMIGAAVNTFSIKTHKDLLIKHFSSLTCENEMKYSSVCPNKGDYNFTRADAIYDFANENGFMLRGHTFVWHNQTPKWVFEDTDKENLLNTMKNHINTLSQKYPNISNWDVVNEAIDDKHGEYLRDSEWLRIIGSEFIDNAFCYAHEAVPNGTLFYNDYNESDPEKRDKICRLVKEMQAKNIPISGIGLQCHWNIHSPGIDVIKAAIEAYASLGLRIHVTEMDISLFKFDDHSKWDKPSEEALEEQARLYGEAFKIFREYKDHIDCVTLWGVADDMTWLDNFPVRGRKNWPLLFDENHNPKKAFYAITDF